MSQSREGKKSPGFLAALGLHRKELRAWAMYDWALSAQETTIAVAVFPIFFAEVAAAGLAEGGGRDYVALSNSLATLVVAVLSPVLGAIADYAAVKKRLLAAFMAMGVISIGLMFFIQRGDYQLASLLFVLALVGGPEAGCSTRPSSRISRAITRWTGSPRPGMPWGTWAEAFSWH
jgi:UMF1 family MFS transporter